MYTPADVGVDLAHLRTNRAGHRDGREIGPASPERRDLVLARQPLESGEDHDVARGEGLDDPLRPDLGDLGGPCCVSVMIPACEPV